MENNKNSTIAIIDSGIGGISILNRLIAKYKTGNFIYFADNLYMPYGNKTSKFLSARLDEIIKNLQTNYNVSKIIIACNTASSVVNKRKYKNLITMQFDEANTYFATPLTKANLPNVKVIEDENLAKNIEENIFNKPLIEKIIKQSVKQHKLNKLPSFVLGCTHYELVIDLFKKYCPKTQVKSNIDFIIDKIKVKPNKDLTVIFLQSEPSLSYNNKMKQLIGR